MNYELLQGNALTVLSSLPDELVDCIITSPPYWGLRDYETAQWEGGAADCDHKPASNSPDPKNPQNDAQNGRAAKADRLSRKQCARCGAHRNDEQIGIEETPEEYTERLVDVFREARRILKADGTVWLNLGDTYNAYNGGSGPSSTIDHPLNARNEHKPFTPQGFGLRSKTLKAKDLVGIPWRVAFALQADGWWLRSDIIWHKPNPMPESVTDRPTKGHEYLFLLSRSEKYHYDAAAISELCSADSYRGSSFTRGKTFQAQNMRKPVGGGERATIVRRNRRTVWTLASLPVKDAHFATYPIELPELCLLAGSREGGIVLDPFAGSGTTGLACLKNNRRFVGIELNPAYVEIAYQRARRHYPLLVTA